MDEKNGTERIKQLEELLKEQQQSARLLVRRDLELARANEKLQEFDEIKSNFISVVAHQLRTPLSGIKWTLNMLLNGDLGALNNDQKTFLMKSYESNNRKLENLPQVYVDPETMRAALQNLLENAIKYTIESGKIVLDVEQVGDMLQISINDTGIGIPEDQKKKIFERFFRGRNAVKRETDGSGLGLYIAKTIVEKHGG